MGFKQDLDLTEIAGFAIQLVGQMGELYLKAGHADPVMYNALRMAGDLADQYKRCAEEDKAPESVLTAIGELANDIYLTAMEAGEIVRRIIEENGLPIELMNGTIHIDGEDTDV